MAEAAGGPANGDIEAPNVQGRSCQPTAHFFDKKEQFAERKTVAEAGSCQGRHRVRQRVDHVELDSLRVLVGHGWGRPAVRRRPGRTLRLPLSPKIPLSGRPTPGPHHQRLPGHAKDAGTFLVVVDIRAAGPEPSAGQSGPGPH